MSKRRRGGTETATGPRTDGRGFEDYMRINGTLVMARLNTGPAYVSGGITVRCGEYEVREGISGCGWMHTVSPDVFREFYTPA